MNIILPPWRATPALIAAQLYTSGKAAWPAIAAGIQDADKQQQSIKKAGCWHPAFFVIREVNHQGWSHPWLFTPKLENSVRVNTSSLFQNACSASFPTPIGNLAVYLNICFKTTFRFWRDTHWVKKLRQNDTALRCSRTDSVRLHITRIAECLPVIFKINHHGWSLSRTSTTSMKLTAREAAVILFLKRLVLIEKCYDLYIIYRVIIEHCCHSEPAEGGAKNL